jgi:hypothetical protein
MHNKRNATRSSVQSTIGRATISGFKLTEFVKSVTALHKSTHSAFKLGGGGVLPCLGTYCDELKHSRCTHKTTHVTQYGKYTYLVKKHCKYENSDRGSSEGKAVPHNYNAHDDGRVVFTVAQWLRHYATSRKVAGWRPNDVNVFFF